MPRLNARWDNFTWRGHVWDRFWLDAASSTVYALTPADSSLAVSCSTVVLTQVHALGVAGGDSSVTGSAPAVTQVHALAVGSGATSVAGGTTALTQAQALTVSSGAVESAASTLEIPLQDAPPGVDGIGGGGRSSRTRNRARRMTWSPQEPADLEGHALAGQPHTRTLGSVRSRAQREGELLIL